MIPIRERPNLEINVSNYLFLKDQCLNNEECDDIINFGKQNVIKGDLGNWSGKFNACGLPIDHYVHKTLNNIWTEAITFFGSNIEFIEIYQLKQYKFGGNFGYHTDHFKVLSNKLDRKLTLTLQLSEEKSYGGGDLIVEGVKLPRERGSLAIFPSIFTHKVTNTGFGERWSLITWAWGKPYL